MPVEPDKAQLVYDAFKMLHGNPAFADVVKLIEGRLDTLDALNRQRGQENQFTEAQAWSWFLAAYRNSATQGEVKTMELQR